MENNCFILKLKNSVLGDYDKLNFLKTKVSEGMTLAFSQDKQADLLIKAEGCTFSQVYYLIIDATEYTFKNLKPNVYLSFKIKGDGYLYVGNKYNLSLYTIYNVDLDKIYSYDKSIMRFIVPYSESIIVNIKGNINHLLSLCSPNLVALLISSNSGIKEITGDITLINEFTNLRAFTYTKFSNFSKDIIMFSSNINLEELALFETNCTGNIEELVLTWYTKGRTSGITEFLLNNTPIIVPSTITNKGKFYCTFTESGYTFSQTKPNS